MRWLDGITNSKDECAQTQGDSEGQGDSWTIRKAEGQRIDAFKLWC